MVRAVELYTGPSGAHWNASQGAFSANKWQIVAAINYNGTTAGAFDADTSMSSPVGTAINLSNGSVTSGTPELIFQTARSIAPNTSGSLVFSLTAPQIVASQTYWVRLYFAEIDNSVDVGDRSFDVLLEGDLLLNDFDPYREIGSFAGFAKTFVVTVDNDGTPDIDLTLTGIGPLISAIKIVSMN